VALRNRDKSARAPPPERGPADRGDATDRIVDRIDAADLWPQIAGAVALLPEGERDALLLYVWEDLGYDEIARALEVPVGTVRSRLNRARQTLRELRASIGREQ
jgi:RNA polymerase sigma factor (sigma-70 family)